MIKQTGYLGRLRFVVLLFLGLAYLGQPAHADLTIYLVRHTEKVSGGEDPGLSPAGDQRALDLARILRSAKIEACFSSQFQRTRQTIAATAKQAGLKPLQHPAGKEVELVELIKREHSDKSVLIAGHSNTVPWILRELGFTTSLKIQEHEFDNLFVVRIDSNGKPSMLHLHYGAANPPEETP